MPIDLRDLLVPIVQAPMAGGPSTPELAAAVSNAGGLGSLAAGYRSVEDMKAEIAATRELTSHPFAVNVFVPEIHASDPADLEAYANELSAYARDMGIQVPELKPATDDSYHEKIEALIAGPVPVVSLTFGLPEQSIISDLQRAGSAVILNATSVAEANMALELRPQALVLQGTEAGGHRAQYDQSAPPSSVKTLDLVEAVANITDVPLIAAGGVSTADHTAQLLAVGAAAVQAGTAFLLAHEAGTKALHRQALESGEFTETVVTRAFSGRPARGLRNHFIDRMLPHEIVGYPEVNYLTGSIRGAATDAHVISAWAGTGFQQLRRASALEILNSLIPK